MGDGRFHRLDVDVQQAAEKPLVVRADVLVLFGDPPAGTAAADQDEAVVPAHDVEFQAFGRQRGRNLADALIHGATRDARPVDAREALRHALEDEAGKLLAGTAARLARLEGDYLVDEPVGDADLVLRQEVFFQAEDGIRDVRT